MSQDKRREGDMGCRLSKQHLDCYANAAFQREYFTDYLEGITG